MAKEEAQPAAESEGGEIDGAVSLPPEEELDQLRMKLQEAQDRFLRGQAELENFRKRSRRELEEERRYAEIELLSDLLPVMDNITRAVEAAEKNADAASLLAGFRMVGQQLESVLEKHHLKRIEAEGQPFDPAFHQAILQQPSDEHPENTVMLEAQSGFSLHDRVVRPTQVIVSTKRGEGE